MYQVDANTVSLLHFDNGIKDETGRVWTAIGGATTTTDKRVFENACLYLNGNGQYLSCPASSDLNFGSGDFTIDFWHANNNPEVAVQYLFNYGEGTYTSGYQFSMYLQKNKVGSQIDHDGNSYFLIQSDTPISDTDKHHIALVRSAATIYLFIDGKIAGQVDVGTTALNPGQTDFRIGSGGDYNGLHYANGYFDEFRISNIARWTAEFAPPSESGNDIVPPTLNAIAGDSKVNLSWTAVTGATGYNVKRSTTAGGPYTTVGSNVSGTTYVDSSVTSGTTYYYIVTAVTATGESSPSNEVSATPQAQVVTSSHCLLRITMNDSSEREYQLTSAEVDAFVKWCDRTVDIGSSLYVFNKDYNIGEFQSRKEYLMFEKIISFEVMQLTK